LGVLKDQHELAPLLCPLLLCFARISYHVLLGYGQMFLKPHDSELHPGINIGNRS